MSRLIEYAITIFFYIGCHIYQLTKTAGSWVPRLERMVESRGLSGFEKNVILALIGSIIQPNKVHSMHTCLHAILYTAHPSMHSMYTLWYV